MCVTLSFHVLSAHRALPVPFSWPLQISEIPAKSGGLDILVQNSFITTKINTRRPHVLTHFPSPLLLWHDMAPNVSLSHHVLTRVYRLCVCHLDCSDLHKSLFFLTLPAPRLCCPPGRDENALKGCNNASGFIPAQWLRSGWSSSLIRMNKAQVHGTIAQELVALRAGTHSLVCKEKPSPRCLTSGGAGCVRLQQGRAAHCIFSTQGWTPAPPHSQAQSWPFPEISRARIHGLGNG